MRRFAKLYSALDEATETNDKVAAMVDYFSEASPQDAAWATYFLSGQRLRQVVPNRLLRTCAAAAAEIPEWLFAESYNLVGDLAETLALVIPIDQNSDDASLTAWVQERLLPIRELDEAEQGRAVQSYLRMLASRERFVMMKLLTGALRVGVDRTLVTRAIAEQSGIPAQTIAHRLMGNWEATAEFYYSLIDPDGSDARLSAPYPFCLANSIDGKPEDLGDARAFAAEWKWDGIRGQIVRRGGQTFIWSRGEELMEGRWPEIEAAAESLPDGTVIDGEILACDGDRVLPFAQLQRRIGRKKVGKKLLSEVPAAFFAFDILESEGNDLRKRAFTERRDELERVLIQANAPLLKANKIHDASSWQQLAEIRAGARETLAEGLMLKRRDAAYGAGRAGRTWWKWKTDPLSIDAVLIYAQRGQGRSASLHSDFTFAVWDKGKLVPFAKTCSGLDDEEMKRVDHFIRNNTNEKFGPVRSVTPGIVMEIAFEGINESSRHKSGLAVRLPRIARWRHDKNPEDANSLSDLKALL